MLIEYHRNMLSDRPRNAAFHRALESVIQKGKTIVADIGSGTGILGFMASRLGAKRVYLFEQAGIMDLAVQLAKDNKIKNVEFIQEHSTAVTGVPMVDVIISETLGNYAFEEQMIETIEDAKRFLKPGGTIIPATVTHFVAPVTSSRFFDELCVWDKVGFDFDFSRAKNMSLNNIFVRTFTSDDLLDAAPWDHVDFTQKNAPNRRGKAEWVLKKSETLYGFAVWWKCELVPGIDLSTAPDAPKTHWEQLYFPVMTPIVGKKGNKISIDITAHSSYDAGTNLRWVVTHNGHKQTMDLDKGFIG